MKIHRALTLLAVIGAAAFVSASRAPATPEQEFVAIVKAFVGMGQPGDWSSLEQLPGIRWAPLPPASLTNCAADGGCFARQGTASIGGRQVGVIATGARTMVLNVYFRNGGAPFGEGGILAAMKDAALTATLARCPVRGGRGSTNWYRIDGTNVSPSYLAVQAATAGRNNEGFVLSAGAELPRLQPNQLAMYSEQCESGAVQTPTATSLPHEQLARTIVSLLLPSSGSATLNWKSLASLSTGITWNGPDAKRGYGDAQNPYGVPGSITLAGRPFSVLATGTATQVRVITLDEGGLHPRGEHMLGVVYQKGIAVQLDHCGPVYTESTNNWYRLTSPTTRPALIRQSIRYDGNQVQDAYELRLDASQPTHDARDRLPGVNGCK